MADTQILEPVLLAALARQGIVAGSVALQRDYAPRSLGQGYSPYTRTYQDKLSGKKFSVTSGLPGCDAYGQAHELVWSAKNEVVENGNNIFHCKLSANSYQLTALSDQPWGAKKDDDVVFHPQLFIDGVEILPLSDIPELLEIDPINENYHHNTLEWDYGVCRRRVRIIEGRFLGSWVFTSAPNGDITIKYNQSGQLRLRLQYSKDADTEFIPKGYFENPLRWPVEISDSATFYPDADPETSSVDGSVYEQGWDTAWHTLVVAPGGAHQDSSNEGSMARYACSTTSNQYAILLRSIYLFDISAIAGATKTAATMSLRGSGKVDTASSTPTCNIYSSNPASNTALENGDYDSLGSTPFCDTPITYPGWLTNNYNDFALNSDGLNALSGNIAKFGLRLNYDVDDNAPNWISGATSYFYGYYADKGSGYQPKLVVTYSTGVTEKSAAETGAGTEVKTSGYPVVITSSAETCAGVESLGSRDLGGTETGFSLESLGSRDLVKNESGSGVDIAALMAAFGQYEAGSGVEAALKIAAFFSGDAGLGAELSWMLKDALASDAGGGYEALRSLIKTAGSAADMRLYESPGKTGLPSKQVRMPSKGVNL